MAFALNALLDVGGGHPGSRTYRYQTNDATATVQAANYFDNAYEYLAVGDVIIASIDLDGTVSVRMFVVTASSSSAVVVADIANA